MNLTIIIMVNQMKLLLKIFKQKTKDYLYLLNIFLLKMILNGQLIINLTKMIYALFKLIVLKY